MYLSIVGIDAIPFPYYTAGGLAGCWWPGRPVPWRFLRAARLQPLLERVLGALRAGSWRTTLPLDFRF